MACCLRELDAALAEAGGEAVTVHVEREPGLPLWAPPPAEPDPARPHDIIAAWEHDLVGQGEKAQPTHERAVTLRNVCREEGWNTPADATHQRVAAHLSALGHKGRKIKTLHTRRSDLSSFFEWMKQQGYCHVNPCDGIRLAKMPGNKTKGRDSWRRLLDQEYAAVLAIARADECSPRPRFKHGIGDLLEMAWWTGGRAGQLAMQAGPKGPGLRWRDCYEDEEIEPHLYYVDSKNGDTWRIPLAPRPVQILRARRAALPVTDLDAFVFPFLYQDRQFKAYLLKAGILQRWPKGHPREGKINPRCPRTGRRVGIHSERTSFQSRLAKVVKEPRVSMELMQHKSIEMTMRVYTELQNEEHAAAIDKLSGSSPPPPPRPPTTYPQEPARTPGRLASPAGSRHDAPASSRSRVYAPSDELVSTGRPVPSTGSKTQSEHAGPGRPIQPSRPAEPAGAVGKSVENLGMSCSALSPAVASTVDSRLPDSNRGPAVYKTAALPLS